LNTWSDFEPEFRRQRTEATIPNITGIGEERKLQYIRQHRTPKTQFKICDE
jgi:hypothetical protein